MLRFQHVLGCHSALQANRQVSQHSQAQEWLDMKQLIVFHILVFPASVQRFKAFAMTSWTAYHYFFACGDALTSFGISICALEKLSECCGAWQFSAC